MGTIILVLRLAGKKKITAFLKINLDRTLENNLSLSKMKEDIKLMLNIIKNNSKITLLRFLKMKRFISII